MKKELCYEWSLETLDENHDIMDCNFEDTLTFDKGSLEGNDLCLLRNIGNEEEGLIDRVYAYVKDGKLPAYFESEMGGEGNSYKIPERFHKELSKYLDK